MSDPKDNLNPPDVKIASERKAATPAKTLRWPTRRCLIEAERRRHLHIMRHAFLLMKERQQTRLMAQEIEELRRENAALRKKLWRQRPM